MEDTLRGGGRMTTAKDQVGLNPCFNGRYSQSSANTLLRWRSTCLNPCFNGRYSQSCQGPGGYSQRRVLILVLMEDTLRGFLEEYKKAVYGVLILVLMEDTLREQRLVSLCLSSFDVCLPL